ncbi:MAG: GIY-YIG nuclease family protein [Chitinophagaceae bacterium]|jgi:putative endonuclease
MSFYVYILQSLKDKSYYKGFTENPTQRLQQHNAGESKYTSTKIPWKLVYVEELPTKKEALMREKYLKKLERSRIELLIDSPKNIHTIK